MSTKRQRRRMELGQIIDKLKDVISLELGDKKVFDKDVAHALGLSKESLSHLKRRNRIPYEAIVSFCAKRAISINWILCDQLPSSLEEKTERYVRIKYFKELRTSAGGGAFNEEEGFEYLNIYYEELNTLSHFKAEHLHAIEVMGDSMEPTLKNADILLCDTLRTLLEDGKVYVIQTPDGLLVKRVCVIENGIVLRSDNSLYEPLYFRGDALESLCVVSMAIGTVETH